MAPRGAAAGARWGCIAAMAALLLGGCLAPGPAGPPGGSAPPMALAYACPPGDPSPTPCLAPVAPPDRRHHEPAAAAHPSAEGTFALAATRLGAAVATHTAATPPTGDPNLCRVVVHVTRDGGATWAASEPAWPPWTLAGRQPVRDRCTRSPDVAFDGEGTLHLVVSDVARTWTSSAMALAGAEPPPAHRVLHLRSADLGATWTAAVLREDANHPYLAFDPATRVLVATVRDFEGDGFSRSAVAWSLDGSQSWQGPLTVPCHLPTRAVFDGGQALFACTDHGALDEGRLLRLHALDPAAGAVSARAEVPVPGTRNLFTALARAPDGRLALAWTPTVPGGDVDGDPHAAVAASCCAFGAGVNLREAVAPDHANAMWTTVRADARGAFHFGVEAWRDRDAAFFHGILGADGSVASSALVEAWTWPEGFPADPAADPVESTLGPWRGSLYPAFAFQERGGLLGTTANAAGALQAARVAP